MRRVTMWPILIAGTVLAAATAGCANTRTTCALNNTEGYCASLEEVEKAAEANAGSKENVMGDGAHLRFKDGGEADLEANANAPDAFVRLNGAETEPGSNKNGQIGSPLSRNGVRNPGPGAGLSGPIYEPAKPRRLWVAPWTDGQGVVHSGEYLYFLTEGRWRYGPLKAPGTAGDILGPVAPDDLGFDPDVVLSENSGGARVQDPNDSADIQRPDSSITPPSGAFQARPNSQQ